MIEALTVADERAAKVVRERAEAGTAAAETVAKAIEIGTRVIDSEGTATNVDYVQRVFEERVGKLGEELSGTLEEGSTEIAKQIAEKLRRRAQRLRPGRDQADARHRDPASAAGARQKMLTARGREQPARRRQMRSAKAMLEAEERHRKQLARAAREPHEGVAGAAVAGRAS